MSAQTSSLKPQMAMAKSVLPPSGILQRKCACGNHTVAGGECAECGKNKTGLQRKLTIGSSNDPLEQEADRVADQVLAAPANSAVSTSPPRIQRFTGQATAGMDTAPASVDRVLAGSGSPLEPALRRDMEQRFGHNFSRVRVHSDLTAQQSARDVNANAYTAGHNIVFGTGRFIPGTHEGRRLIAHELTHVVQQSGAVRMRVGHSKEERRLSALSPLQIVGTGTLKIARAPDTDPNPGSSGRNFTPAQAQLLEQARQKLKPVKPQIVGVLLDEKGQVIDRFISGGGQGADFNTHIEGKATAKMNELGIKEATLIVEKEPCLICDRSVYPGGKKGPELPLKSTSTGSEIDYQMSKINSALPKGSKLTVVGPDSTGVYHGISTPKVGTPGSPPITGGPPKTAPGTTQKTQPPPTTAAKSTKPTVKAPPGTPEKGVTPIQPAAPKVSPSSGSQPSTQGQLPPSGDAARAIAAARSSAKGLSKAIGAELVNSLKITRAAGVIRAGLVLLQAVGALLLLKTFTDMAQAKLDGKAFVLGKEIAQAQSLVDQSRDLERDYPAHSESINSKSAAFLLAPADPGSLRDVILAAFLVFSDVVDLRDSLEKQIPALRVALKEIKAKRAAARAILDTNASGVLAAATLATAELTQIFGAWEELGQLEGKLGSALSGFETIEPQVRADTEFLRLWLEWLREVAAPQTEPSDAR